MAVRCDRIYERVASPDKTRLEYEGVPHAPHNDLGAEAVMGDVAQWLDQQRSRQSVR
ncbi:MAG: hypothetical protein M3176_19075 [Chloroflexota bacterium]|nr:hypothetical protein [Chloroflexota bacterium]MDQ6908927.1 hypothetical protein [Chloroflexota bacterium]